MTQLDLSNLSFLVVDDNAFMRKLLKSMLAAVKVGDIQDASDGVGAFKMMKDGYAPDVILTDAKMPVMSGLELTRWVRTTDEVARNDIPIILVTAFTESKVVIAARDAGVDEFLAKPVAAEDLLQRVERVLTNPRPYVQSSVYKGPERRRKQARLKGEDRRDPDQEPPLPRSDPLVQQLSSPAYQQT